MSARKPELAAPASRFSKDDDGKNLDHRAAPDKFADLPAEFHRLFYQGVAFGFVAGALSAGVAVAVALRWQP